MVSQTRLLLEHCCVIIRKRMPHTKTALPSKSRAFFLRSRPQVRNPFSELSPVLRIPPVNPGGFLYPPRYLSAYIVFSELTDEVRCSPSLRLHYLSLPHLFELWLSRLPGLLQFAFPVLRAVSAESFWCPALPSKPRRPAPAGHLTSSTMLSKFSYASALAARAWSLSWISLSNSRVDRCSTSCSSVKVSLSSAGIARSFKALVHGKFPSVCEFSSGRKRPI